jgi:NADH-quinone oxidoreductase subunit N
MNDATQSAELLAEIARCGRHFLPETILTAALLLVVLVDASLARLRGRVCQILTLLGLAAALVLTVRADGYTGTLWFGMLTHDPLGRFFAALIIGAALLVVASFTFRNARELAGLNPGEFYALMLAATLSSLLLAAASDLAMLYLALEMLSLSSYILVAYFKGDRMSNEASLKYLLFGAASTGSMLYGLSLIYGLTGTTRLDAIQRALAAGLNDASATTLYVAVVFVVAGFGFKTAAVPFHFWCPDAYEGAPTPVTAYLSVVPKTAGFAILTRFFFGGLASPLDSVWQLAPSVQWPALLMVMSALTMTVGNVAALTQTNMKRLLAYSSIAHAGYVMMGVVALTENGVRGVLVYLFAYLLMNLGAFLVVLLVHKHEGTFDLRDYPGLLRRSPLLTAAMSVFVLSLMGIPPLVGFVGKLYVFGAVIEKGPGYYWFAIVGALNAALAAFYYARILKAMVIDEEDPGVPAKPVVRLALADRGWLAFLAVANLAPLGLWRAVDGWVRGALSLYAGR